MAFFSDFFLATPQEVQTCSAEDFCDFQRFVNHFPVLAWKNFGPELLDSLEYILLGTDFKLNTKNFHSDLARDLGEDGPWIYPVRLELVEALATVSAPQLSEVGKTWSNTEELQRIDPRIVVEYLEELSGFIRQPRPNGELLYVRYQL